MECPKCGETFFLERTKYPFTEVDFTSFDPKPVQFSPMVCAKFYYKNRYIRLAIEPEFVEDQPVITGERVVGVLKRIIKEEGGS